MIVLDNPAFQVRSRFFGGFRVTFKPTGATLLPTQDQTERVGLLWHKLRRGKFKRMSPPGQIAEDIMFDIFAQAVLAPDSQASIDFVGMDLDQLAFAIVQEANVQHTATKLSGGTNT